MEQWVLIFLVSFALRAFSQDTTQWVSIDCGSETSYVDRIGIMWKTDEEFINTGQNMQVSSTNGDDVVMDSLRVFTQQNKNCYSLPAPLEVRYFIRAGFYYGNYDGLSKPPSFDLQFDGNNWATVVSSIKEPLYYEVIYTSKGDYISVCVALTNEKQFPFISSLEAFPLPENMYDEMTGDFAWFSNYRFHYGGKDVIGYPNDTYNRLWGPMNTSGLNPVTADFTSLVSTNDDYPPESALIQAVEAPNPTDSINLSFDMGIGLRFNYIVLYYTEMTVLALNESRSFDIHVDHQDLGPMPRPKYRVCTAVWVKTKFIGPLTIELRPTLGSTVPPIISAIEVYTASNTLITTGTFQDDLDGLEILLSAFEEQLGGWSGDPCLPSETAWQWLSCSVEDPPRVTALYLSGYELDGALPQFDQMQALETIDLSNNSLDGPIPDFLARLPNLRLLNLGGNNFSGNIPESLIDNKRISYHIDGNPLLHHQKGNNSKALIIGLAVGLPLGFLLLIVCLVYYLHRRQKQRIQEQVTITELANLDSGVFAQAAPQKDEVSMSLSTEEQSKPFHEEQIPTSANAGEPVQPFAMPDMDLDELNELLQQHGREGANGRHKDGEA